MSFILSFSLYFLSFSPLWLNVLFLDVKSLLEGGNNKYTEVISIIFILFFELITLVCLFYKFYISNSDIVEKYELSQACEIKTITSEFLLSYILPLFAFDFTQWDGVVEFLVFFAVLGYLCIKHNNFSVNIILELLQYNIYECILVNDDGVSINKMIISKQELNVIKGKGIQVKTINNEFSLDVTK